ncbi:MAG: glycoside hydrolase family 127 protein [Promethearchaeota archaeon]
MVEKIYLQEIEIEQISISDDFWDPLLQKNRRISILHQWQMLENYGSLDNFRIVAKLKEGFRRGFFYTDSDVHKWAEAAAWILLAHKSNQNLKNQSFPEFEKLENRLTEYIDIIEKAQTFDGYLFTHNQFHFPKRRWANLLIEHELYCLGHLIEAGLAHYRLDSNSRLLGVAQRAADLVVSVFLKNQRRGTPGHPEIELALIKLYLHTDNRDYFDLAVKFIEDRGKTHFFGLQLAKENADQTKRANMISKQRASSKQGSQHDVEFGFMETMTSREKKRHFIRSMYQFLTGKYFQENKLFRKRDHPEGHSVRFGYLQASITKMAKILNDSQIFSLMDTTWDNMIKEHMYVTGGLGALPLVEGFGRAFELPNDEAYCETCAGIAGIFWSWEMFLVSENPKFLDIIELQLYNATLVGIGFSGDTYSYRNVLEASGNMGRKNWYLTPCCPSNVSRLWGQIGKYVYSVKPNTLFVNQYIGNDSQLSLPLPDSVQKPELLDVRVTMKCDLVINGLVSITLDLQKSQEFEMKLRFPSWSSECTYRINDEAETTLFHALNQEKIKIITASGQDPFSASWISLKRNWNSGDVLTINFSQPIRILKSPKKVKFNRSHYAFARGPLVYCIESKDNPNFDFLKNSIPYKPDIRFKFQPDSFEGIPTLIMQYPDSQNNPNGSHLNLIPYYIWANRGLSHMKVWIPHSSKQ